MSQFALRLPEDLHTDVKRLAEEQGVSMNHFLVYALASKISEMKTSQEYFRKRTGDITKEQAIRELREFQAKVPSGEIMQGDELP